MKKSAFILFSITSAFLIQLPVVASDAKGIQDINLSQIFATCAILAGIAVTALVAEFNRREAEALYMHPLENENSSAIAYRCRVLASGFFFVVSFILFCFLIYRH